MKFPRTIRHHRATAKIYGKSRAYPFYRVTWYDEGKRHVRSFAAYGAAKAIADKVVRDLNKGSKAASLSMAQSSDAIAAIQRLARLFRETGRQVSLLEAVSEFAEATTKAEGRNLQAVVEEHRQTVATIARKDLSKAVEEFIEGRQHKTEAKDGKRAQLSSVYAYNVAMWLKEFAATHPGMAVCDLGKDHMDVYIGEHKKVSAKSRNDRRAAVKMFLNWCARKDYLARNHRLFEADGMAREIVETGEIDFYRPKELKSLLDEASKALRPVIALGGLAGLRSEEIMRLEWADVWRVPGHIEIAARKAKGRQRRLVEMFPALEEWLADYKEKTGPVWTQSIDAYQENFAALRVKLEIPSRRNGLRHAFCTYHFALHANENLTAAQAGNSPSMIHAHYKGLATRAEAPRWFAVKPEPKSDGDKAATPKAANV